MNISIHKINDNKLNKIRIKNKSNRKDMNEIAHPEKITNLRFNYTKKGLNLTLIPAIRSVVYRAETPNKLQIEVEFYADVDQTESFDSIVFSAPIGEDNTNVIKSIIVQYLKTNPAVTEI